MIKVYFDKSMFAFVKEGSYNSNSNVPTLNNDYQLIASDDNVIVIEEETDEDDWDTLKDNLECFWALEEIVDDYIKKPNGDIDEDWFPFSFVDAFLDCFSVKREWKQNKYIYSKIL